MGLEIARRLRGLLGMIVAYLCLVVPGSLVMIGLGATYEFYQNEPAVRGALQGLQCAATALILYSATRLNLARWNLADYLLALGACLACLAWGLPTIFLLYQALVPVVACLLMAGAMSTAHSFAMPFSLNQVETFLDGSGLRLDRGYLDPVT